jgi:hypothetical protein
MRSTLSDTDLSRRNKATAQRFHDAFWGRQDYLTWMAENFREPEIRDFCDAGSLRNLGVGSRA